MKRPSAPIPFSAYLRESIASLSMTHPQFSRAIGIHLRTLGNWLAGTDSTGNPVTLKPYKETGIRAIVERLKEAKAANK